MPRINNQENGARIEHTSPEPMLGGKPVEFCKTEGIAQVLARRIEEFVKWILHGLHVYFKGGSRDEKVEVNSPGEVAAVDSRALANKVMGATVEHEFKEASIALDAVTKLVLAGGSWDMNSMCDALCDLNALLVKVRSSDGTYKDFVHMLPEEFKQQFLENIHDFAFNDEVTRLHAGSDNDLCFGTACKFAETNALFEDLALSVGLTIDEYTVELLKASADILSSSETLNALKGSNFFIDEPPALDTVSNWSQFDEYDWDERLS